MVYTPVVWQDNVTPLDEVHFNQMDQGIVALDTGKVSSDSVVVAASRLVASKLLAADSNPAFRILGDGKLQWGQGGAVAPDTALYRAAAGVLNADIALSVYGGVTVDRSNTASRLFFGSAGDTSLYRPAVNELQTGGRFWANNLITGANSAAPTTAAQGIYFGSNGDTNLYRAGAGNLKTDGTFLASTAFSTEGFISAAGSILAAKDSPTNKIQLHTDGYIYWGGDTVLGRTAVGVLNTNGGFSFSGDTHLYRLAANVLATGSAFSATGAIWSNNNTGGAYSGIVFGTAQDTNLYRQAAGVVASGGAISANHGSATQVYIGATGAGYAGVQFGSAYDANIYRSAAGAITTGSNFYAPYVFSTNDVHANAGAVNQIALAANGKIYFSNAYDTTLYRVSAGELKTDGTLQVAQLRTTATGHTITYDGELKGAIGTSTSSSDNSIRVYIDGVPYKFPVWVSS